MNTSMSLKSTVTAIVAFAFGTLLSGSMLANSTLLGPGIVTDSSDNALFFITQNNGYLAAIDASGKALWQLRDVGLPLISTTEGVLALQLRAGKEQLVWLARDTGRTLAQTEWKLPNEVELSVLPDASRRQSLRAFVSGSNAEATASAFELQWSYSNQTLRGALIEDDADAAVVSRAGASLVRIDGDQLQITTIEQPSRHSELPINLLADERITVASDEGRMQFCARDAMAVVAIDEQADARFGSMYRWQVYARDAGKTSVGKANADKAQDHKLGEITLPFPIAEFVVRKQTLVARLMPYAWLESSGNMQGFGESLVGFDLRTGEELWRVPVVDSSYRGVLPP